MKNQYSLKTVSRLTGLTPETIRAWEARYQAIQPVRSKTPQRRRIYSQYEVNRLQILFKLTQVGHRISDLSGKKDSELSALLHAQGLQNQHSSRVDDDLIQQLFDVIKKFDLPEVEYLFTKIRFLMSPEAFVLQFIPQILMGVGQLIDQDEISIFQEHAISELIRRTLWEIYDSIEVLERGSHFKGKEKILFCTRSGDPHDFGLLMAAIICRFMGVQTQYIGKDLPVDALVVAVKNTRPSIVLLSLTELPPEEEKIAPLLYLQGIRQNISKGVEIWVGGSTVNLWIGKRKSHERTKIPNGVFLIESLQQLKDTLKQRLLRV